MTALDVSFRDRPDGWDVARWTASLLVVLALHLALVAGILTKGEPALVAESSPPAVLFDMAPPEPVTEPAVPAPASPAVEPAPPAEPAPPVETAEPPPPEVVPLPDAQPEPAPQPAPEPQVRAETPKVETPAVPEVTEAPAPKPPPKPRVEPQRREPPREARPQPARPAEPPRGLSLRLQPAPTRPAGLPSLSPPVQPDIPYQPGSADRTSAVESFERRLVAHLARYKRYPQSSQLRREQGVVIVRFTMDAAGNVLSTTILRSSGVPALDQEVEALLQRAQPLPPLPPESGLSRFQVEMPVQFYLWQR